MNFKLKLICCSTLFLSWPLFAKLKVVTTLSDLGAIVEKVGGPHVQVESICQGKKDPHFLTAKPSYILKVSRADLVVANGLGLEVGWLPKLISSARNTQVTPGKKGYFEAGSQVSVLDIPEGPISRAHGDVHPEGNPHITLDPVRVGQIALAIAHRLSGLDSKNKKIFEKNAQDLQKKLLAKTEEWKKRIEKTGIKSVVTYHETLLYFLDRFGIKKTGVLEPFPGVPPTGKHILKVMNEASESGTKLILVEHYFDVKAAHKAASQVPGVRVASVPVAVEKKNLSDPEAVIENLVKILEKNRIQKVKKDNKKTEVDTKRTEKSNKKSEKKPQLEESKTPLPIAPSKTPQAQEG